MKAKLFLVILAFLVPVSSAKAQKQDNYFGDSALYVLSMQCFDSIKSPTFFEMQQRGLKEADHKRNEHFQYVFRSMVVSRYKTLMDKENFRKESEKLIKYYEQENNEKRLFTVWYSIIDGLQLWGDYAESVVENKKMAAYAYKHHSQYGIIAANFYFAQSYLNNNKVDEAMTYYRKVLADCIPSKHYGLGVRSAFNLVNIYSGLGCYKEALALSDSIPALISGWEKDKGIAMNPVFRVKQSVYRMLIFIEMGDKVNATLCRDSVLYYNNVYADRAQQYTISYNMALYDRMMGNYSGAITTLHRLISELEATKNYPNLADCRLLLARVESDKNDYKAAARDYEKYVIAKDSANIEESNAQLNRLTKTFHLTELEQENEIVRQKQRNTLLMIYGISTVAVLILVICVILIINRRQLLKCNRELMDRIRKEEQLEAEAQKRRSMIPVKARSIHERIFADILKLLADEEVLRMEKLTRDELGELTGTNRTYVMEAVSRYANGCTVSELVNRARCRYARQLLEQNPTMPISHVAYRAGFKNAGSFSNAYRAHYKVSPREYRKINR